ncbi:MAG: purine-nucleoside phosphorylase [Ignavibacteriaceae bacterium]|nr:purine-nucleoside phosphorylase [Ignavibacteriaceae bacterium]
MIDINEYFKPVLTFLEDFFDRQEFDIVFVLGSGFSESLDFLDYKLKINYTDIAELPDTSVFGHKGVLTYGEYKNKKILSFHGRFHYYEGHSMKYVLFPAVAANYFKTKSFILTNAAGGINQYFAPGDLMICKSFAGFNIKNELSDFFSRITLEQKNKFLQFPDEQLNKIILNAALKSNIHLKEGVYWYNKGPCYETPAEVQMARILGADAVGMSTVPEAYFAAVSNIPVCAISCITNYAAGISTTKLNHEEVHEQAMLIKDKIRALFTTIITDI